MVKRLRVTVNKGRHSEDHQGIDSGGGGEQFLCQTYRFLRKTEQFLRKPLGFLLLTLFCTSTNFVGHVTLNF
jgi:hypothetical protein